jgi:hypothetical protein
MELVNSNRTGRVFEVLVRDRTYLRVQIERQGLSIVQAAVDPGAGGVPFLDNPAGFSIFSGDRSRAFQFEVRPIREQP